MSDTFTVHVPMAFQRRGGRKLIVTPDGTAMPAVAPRFNIDNVLVKALARAFRWQKLLDAGTGHFQVNVTPEDADIVYVSESGRPDPARAQKLDGRVYET